MLPFTTFDTGRIVRGFRVKIFVNELSSDVVIMPIEREEAIISRNESEWMVSLQGQKLCGVRWKGQEQALPATSSWKMDLKREFFLHSIVEAEEWFDYKSKREWVIWCIKLIE